MVQGGGWAAGVLSQSACLRITSGMAGVGSWNLCTPEATNLDFGRCQGAKWYDREG